MPVEIRELVIRAVVTDQSRPNSSGDAREKDEDSERAEIIEECVREVLNRLEKLKER